MFVSEKVEFEAQISKLCRELAQRATEQKLTGRTIQVEFKTAKMKVK